MQFAYSIISFILCLLVFVNYRDATNNNYLCQAINRNQNFQMKCSRDNKRDQQSSYTAHLSAIC